MQILDWAVLAAYGGVVLLIGVLTGRKHQTPEDLFLGGRRIPAWAALCSMVATELSAATFIGVPQLAYTGDWWYLQYAIGSLAARIVLATTLLSLYYRLRVVTVYGFLGHRFGRGAQLCSAWFFLVGRLFASGSRLFIAAVAFATVTGFSMEWSIVLAGSVAGVYTLFGGIRAVIWTDTLQGAVFLVAAATALVIVFGRLGAQSVLQAAGDADKTEVFQVPSLFMQGTSAGEVWGWLRQGWEGFKQNYLGDETPLFVAIGGGFFLTMATHGTDQDMVQRLLTTRSSAKGKLALIGSGLAAFPLVILFLLVGTALWAFYGKSGAFAGGYDIASAEKIFPVFILHEVPAGLRGLLFAGLFAAAMSSMDSALNSMATTWVVDIRGNPKDAVGSARRATVVFAVLLVGAAIALVSYKSAMKGSTGESLSLISLALSTMTIVYGGLLGAFMVGLLAPSRGTSRSVVLGMVAGGLVGAFLFLHVILFDLEKTLIAWSWWIPITSVVSFAVGASVPSRAR